MNIYVVKKICDNPLFEGLAMLEGAEVLETWPKDWRANYRTWEPRCVADAWTVPRVIGNVRKHNDFPCINLSMPAFSQRAVDLLSDMLVPNGELLPVRHQIGTYYFYNCRRVADCIDLNKSKTIQLKDGVVASTEKLIFLDEAVVGLTIFRVRTLLLELFCTQTFADRVEAAALQGFLFIPIWPLPESTTYYDEMYRMGQLGRKWKPKTAAGIDIKANTLVLRLYCNKKKPTKGETLSAEEIVSILEKALYKVEQDAAKSYFGNLEGIESCDSEIRIFMSAPDCDRLVAYLMPQFKSLPWPGKLHVVKRRGEYADIEAAEEYVRII